MEEEVCWHVLDMGVSLASICQAGSKEPLYLGIIGWDMYDGADSIACLPSLPARARHLGDSSTQFRSEPHPMTSMAGEETGDYIELAVHVSHSSTDSRFPRRDSRCRQQVRLSAVDQRPPKRGTQRCPSRPPRFRWPRSDSVVSLPVARTTTGSRRGGGVRDLLSHWFPPSAAPRRSWDWDRDLTDLVVSHPGQDRAFPSSGGS